MNKTVKIFFVLSFFFILCVLGYTLYKWNDYKQRYAELQKEMSQSSAISETLSPIDCLVISRSDSAYLKCNVEHSIMRYGYGEGVLSHRDYLLYCYILAIRDYNSDAATDFVSYYLNDIDNGNISADSAMVIEAKRLLLQAINDTSEHDDALIKFIAGEWLKEIYNGTYGIKFKDSVLYQHYCDTVTKYAKML